MGKRAVIVGFLLCLTLASLAYFNRDTRSLRENMMRNASKEPRVLIESFVYYRYVGSELVSRLTARVGRFHEPNIIELDGEIRGERLTQSGRQTLSAESAIAYFDNGHNGSARATNKMKLSRAEMSGFVEVGVKGHVLTTDFAEYSALDNTVQSSRPVRVEGPNRTFMGEEGFIYSVDNESLEMTGLVKGVVTPDAS